MTIALAALLFVLAVGVGFSLTRPKDGETSNAKSEVAEAKNDRYQQACASAATYDRLKAIVFEQAARVRNSDPANLNLLATNAVARMENPAVKSRDEELDVIVCTGRFVLELPPGAEKGIGGERRLVADVEYAAQAAADGSGLLYQLKGAEPIVYKLAAFNLQDQPLQQPVGAPSNQMAEAQIQDPAAEADDRPNTVTAPQPAPRPAPPQPAPPTPRAEPAPPVPQPQPKASAQARPSFNCGSARTRGELMVCGNSRLGSLDRRMSSLYFQALSDADGGQRRALQSTRNRFLAYRDRCRDEACVADAYQGRMQEIRDIMSN